MTTLRTLAALAALTLASACAPAPDAEPGDPLESWNRGVFAFNDALDSAIIEPAAQAYRFITPQPIRTGVSNIFGNLREPITFANALLQGNVNGAFTSFWRFVLNSTVGLGGFLDVADSATDLKKHKEDLGQTLAVWGWTDSTYIMLPILGPSTTRDMFGLVGDHFAHPMTYVLDEDLEHIGYHAGEGLAARESLLDVTKDVDETSLDAYATYRSLYLQKRASLIENRKESDAAK